MRYKEIRERLHREGVWSPARVWQRGHYTCAVVEVRLGEQWYEGVGFAKYNPNDADCPDTPYSAGKGEIIARGHAEMDIAEQVSMDAFEISMAPGGLLAKVFRNMGAAMARLLDGAVRGET